jgi:predicted nuclease of predicted toxin-antitoxin system
VKVLVDEAFSWRLARLLNVAGVDAVHARDVVAQRQAAGFARTTDGDLMQYALDEDRVVVTRDKTDFGEWLAAQKRTKPSVVVFRGIDRIDDQAELLFRCFRDRSLEAALTAGAIVVLEHGAFPRIRTLPIE